MLTPSLSLSNHRHVYELSDFKDSGYESDEEIAHEKLPLRMKKKSKRGEGRSSTKGKHNNKTTNNYSSKSPSNSLLSAKHKTAICSTATTTLDGSFAPSDVEGELNSGNFGNSLTGDSTSTPKSFRFRFKRVAGRVATPAIITNTNNNDAINTTCSSEWLNDPAVPGHLNFHPQMNNSKSPYLHAKLTLNIDSDSSDFDTITKNFKSESDFPSAISGQQLGQLSSCDDKEDDFDEDVLESCDSEFLEKSLSFRYPSMSKKKAAFKNSGNSKRPTSSKRPPSSMANQGFDPISASASASFRATYNDKNLLGANNLLSSIDGQSGQSVQSSLSVKYGRSNLNFQNFESISDIASSANSRSIVSPIGISHNQGGIGSRYMPEVEEKIVGMSSMNQSGTHLNAQSGLNSSNYSGSSNYELASLVASMPQQPSSLQGSLGVNNSSKSGLKMKKDFLSVIGPEAAKSVSNLSSNPASNPVSNSVSQLMNGNGPKSNDNWDTKSSTTNAKKMDKSEKRVKKKESKANDLMAASTERASSNNSWTTDSEESGNEGVEKEDTFGNGQGFKSTLRKTLSIFKGRKASNISGDKKPQNEYLTNKKEVSTDTIAQTNHTIQLCETGQSSEASTFAASVMSNSTVSDNTTIDKKSNECICLFDQGFSKGDEKDKDMGADELPKLKYGKSLKKQFSFNAGYMRSVEQLSRNVASESVVNAGKNKTRNSEQINDNSSSTYDNINNTHGQEKEALDTVAVDDLGLETLDHLNLPEDSLINTEPNGKKSNLSQAFNQLYENDVDNIGSYSTSYDKLNNQSQPKLLANNISKRLDILESKSNPASSEVEFQLKNDILALPMSAPTTGSGDMLTSLTKFEENVKNNISDKALGSVEAPSLENQQHLKKQNINDILACPIPKPVADVDIHSLDEKEMHNTIKKLKKGGKKKGLSSDEFEGIKKMGNSLTRSFSRKASGFFSRRPSTAANAAAASTGLVNSTDLQSKKSISSSDNGADPDFRSSATVSAAQPTFEELVKRKGSLSAMKSKLKAKTISVRVKKYSKEKAEAYTLDKKDDNDSEDDSNKVEKKKAKKSQSVRKSKLEGSKDNQPLETQHSIDQTSGKPQGEGSHSKSLKSRRRRHKSLHGTVTKSKKQGTTSIDKDTFSSDDEEEEMRNVQKSITQMNILDEELRRVNEEFDIATKALINSSATANRAASITKQMSRHSSSHNGSRASSIKGLNFMSRSSSSSNGNNDSRKKKSTIGKRDKTAGKNDEYEGRADTFVSGKSVGNSKGAGKNRKRQKRRAKKYDTGNGASSLESLESIKKYASHNDPKFGADNNLAVSKTDRHDEVTKDEDMHDSKKHTHKQKKKNTNNVD